MKTSPIQIIKDIIKMTLATIIVGSSVFLFLEPSHAAVSSVSGLSIVLTNFMPFSVAQITMFLNVTLLVIGFFTCGHSFGIKTVYTSILLPIVIRVYEKLLPNYTSMTGDATLDVVCYIFTVSIGIAMLFNMNASSGGIDIIAMILNKYLHIELGKALGAAGLVIALSSALAYDGKTVVLSLLGSYLNGFIVDHYIFDHDMKRRVCIVSVLVLIRTGLESSLDADELSLGQIFFTILGLLAKYGYSWKIRLLFFTLACRTINSKTELGYCHLRTVCVSEFWVSCKPSDKNYTIHCLHLFLVTHLS